MGSGRDFKKKAWRAVRLDTPCCDASLLGWDSYPGGGTVSREGQVSSAYRRTLRRTGGEGWGGRGKVQGRGRLPHPGHRILVLRKSTNLTRGTKFWLGTWSNTAPVWSFSVLQTRSPVSAVC